MSRSLADAKTTRVAVLGAATAVGTLLRAALADDGIAGARVDLFGYAEGDALLSEYAGEARLVQPPDPDEVLAHDVVFLCEGGAAAQRAIAAAGTDRLVLDLVAASGRATAVPVVHPDINPQAAAGHRGILRVPHAISCLVAEVLAPVERTLGIRAATAFVLRPASDFGEAGIEELRDQTLSLLRFDEPPKTVFGGKQLAFNVIAQHALAAADEPALTQRIAEEVEAILGWTEGRLAVSLAVVPVFHGHLVALRVEPRETTDSPAREAVLRAALAPSPSPDTPIELDETAGTSVVSLAPDGLGGYWVSALAGRASAGFAARAVRLARTAGKL